MDEPHVRQRPEERPRGQPLEELVAVRRLQHVVERVAVAQAPQAGVDPQQVDVVVAEDAAGVERPHEPQRAERVRPAVHEVADGVEAVARGVEADGLEEPLQLGPAALDVTDEDVARHQESMVTAP